MTLTCLFSTQAIIFNQRQPTQEHSPSDHPDFSQMTLTIVFSAQTIIFNQNQRRFHKNQSTLVLWLLSAEREMLETVIIECHITYPGKSLIGSYQRRTFSSGLIFFESEIFRRKVASGLISGGLYRVLLAEDQSNQTLDRNSFSNLESNPRGGLSQPFESTFQQTLP